VDPSNQTRGVAAPEHAQAYRLRIKHALGELRRGLVDWRLRMRGGLLGWLSRAFFSN
jgi:hypothetical protein